MKEDSTAARQAPQAAATAAAPAPAPASTPAPGDDFSNRKLIRPTLTRPEQTERRERPAGSARKAAPPEQTHAENFYYQKQMQTHTHLVVVLKDGEQIHGTIEWYDRDCIKITRSGQSNILLYKPSIKYIYKDESGTAGNGTGNKR